MRCHRLFAAALVAVTLVACSPLPTDVVSPRVSVAGLRIIEIGLLEQRYAVRLRVQNPNDFAFAITGMDYTLEVNGREFAHGVSDSRVDLPAYSERTVEVLVSSGLADVVEQLRALDTGRMNGLDYRIHGHVSLEGFVTRIPFDHSAELLPSAPGKAPTGGTLRSTALHAPGGGV